LKVIITNLLLLSIVLFFFSCTKKTKTKSIINTKLIPIENNLIVELKFKDLLSLLPSIFQEDIEKFKKELGIDVKLISSITIFTKINYIKDFKNFRDKSFYSLIINGDNLDKNIFQKIPRLLKRFNKEFKTINYSKFSIYKQKEETMSLVANKLIAAKLYNTKKILDLSKNKGRSIDENKFISTFKEINTSSFKAIFFIPKEIKKEIHNYIQLFAFPIIGLTEFINEIKAIVVEANLSKSSIELRFIISSETKVTKTLVIELNKKLPKLLETTEKRIKDIFTSLKIKQNKNKLIGSIKIPKSILYRIKF